MPIERIEALIYGVDNMEDCIRFLADAGLEEVGRSPTEAVFRTVENQRVILRPADDPGLAPAIEAGPTLRRLVWGVRDTADLDQLARDLGGEARREGDMVLTTDPNGLELGFMVADRTAAPVDLRGRNQNRHFERVNDRLEPRGAPRPLRIVHVALNITKAADEAALAFYTGPLRFKPVDKVLDTGTFLQSEGDIEHHNFFLCFRPDKAGINHFAMELWDLDSVAEAGNHMIDNGWRESRKMGRHRLGSNIYRFIHAPFGGRIEFVADMDRMDKSWETRVFEKNPGHNLWMLKSTPEPAGGDGGA